MHAGCKESSTDLKLLGLALGIDAMQYTGTFGVHLVIPLVSCLQHHRRLDEITQLRLVTEHVDGTAGIDHARTNFGTWRYVRLEVLRRAGTRPEDARQCLAAETCRLNVARRGHRHRRDCTPS